MAGGLITRGHCFKEVRMNLFLYVTQCACVCGSCDQVMNVVKHKFGGLMSGSCIDLHLCLSAAGDLAHQEMKRQLLERALNIMQIILAY